MNMKSKLLKHKSIFPFIICFKIFRETSSESSGSDSSYSESSSEETSEEERKKKVVYRRPVPVVKPKFTIANLQTIKKFTPAKRKVVKDRFYDRSRDIPNDIYFGDVKGKQVDVSIPENFSINLNFSSTTCATHTLGFGCF